MAKSSEIGFLTVNGGPDAHLTEAGRGCVWVRSVCGRIEKRGQSILVE